MELFTKVHWKLTSAEQLIYYLITSVALDRSTRTDLIFGRSLNFTIVSTTTARLVSVGQSRYFLSVSCVDYFHSDCAIGQTDLPPPAALVAASVFGPAHSLDIKTRRRRIMLLMSQRGQVSVSSGKDRFPIDADERNNSVAENKTIAFVFSTNSELRWICR